MRLPPLASVALSVLALAFAAPVLSCVAEPLEELPAREARTSETSESTTEETQRTSDAVGAGYGDTPLAFLGDTILLPPSVDVTEERVVDPFAFRIEGPGAESVALPDFSALGKRGYSFGFRSDEPYRSSVYSTSSRGDVYYFQAFGRGGKMGYGVAHAAPGKNAEVHELPVNAYAFFPSQILVRDNDVIVGASTVKEGTFGDDFPGCPISIFHGQNGVFLARIGTDGVTPIVFPGEGRLDRMSTADDGALVVQTGWPVDEAMGYEANVRETWRLAAGAWTRTARVVIPPTVGN